MANTFTIKTVFQAVDKFTGTTNAIKKKIDEIGGSADKAKASLGESFGKLGSGIKKTALILTASAAIAAGVGAQFVSAAAEVQQYKTTLVTMLGSQEAANARFEEMSKFAASTPFEMKDVVQLGNQLQALGRYSKENMTILGDLAAASGKPIDQATRAFSKLASGQKGVAVDMFRDLLISTDDWVKATGKGVAKSGELMASTEEMLAVLPAILKSKGFSGMMAEQSKTFNGRVSNMNDALFQFKAAMGQAMLGPIGKVVELLTPLIQKFTDWANANQEVIGTKVESFVNGLIEGIRTLVSVVGGIMKVLGPFTPLIVAIVAAIAAYNAVMVIYEIVTTAAAVAQMILNGAMLLNPVGLVVAGIILLIGVIALLVKNFDHVKAAMLAAWEIVKGLGQAFMKYLLLPVNLVMEAIGGLLRLLSKLPFVGDKIAPAVDALDNFQANMNKTLTGTEGALDFKGVAENAMGNASAAMSGGAPMSTQTQTINRNNNSTVDVNFNNTPPGTRVAATGPSAPGVTLNTGSMFGGR